MKIDRRADSPKEQLEVPPCKKGGTIEVSYCRIVPDARDEAERVKRRLRVGVVLYNTNDDR